MIGNLDQTDKTLNNKDKLELVHEIKKQFTDLLMMHTSGMDDERHWILSHCTNPVLLERISDMTIIMLHVLDAVGRLEPVNSITISKDTNIPKGTVSKIIPKLLSKEFIIKEALPDNKKESIFTITPLGKELFYLHQTMHEEANLMINAFLINYDSSELQFLIQLLKDFSNTVLLNKNDKSSERSSQ